MCGRKIYSIIGTSVQSSFALALSNTIVIGQPMVWLGSDDLFPAQFPLIMTSFQHNGDLLVKSVRNYLFKGKMHVSTTLIF